MIIVPHTVDFHGHIPNKLSEFQRKVDSFLKNVWNYTQHIQEWNLNDLKTELETLKKNNDGYGDFFAYYHKILHWVSIQEDGKCIVHLHELEDITHEKIHGVLDLTPLDQTNAIGLPKGLMEKRAYERVLMDILNPKIELSDCIYEAIVKNANVFFVDIAKNIEYLKEAHSRVVKISRSDESWNWEILDTDIFPAIVTYLRSNISSENFISYFSKVFEFAQQEWNYFLMESLRDIYAVLLKTREFVDTGKNIFSQLESIFMWSDMGQKLSRYLIEFTFSPHSICKNIEKNLEEFTTFYRELRSVCEKIPWSLLSEKFWELQSRIRQNSRFLPRGAYMLILWVPQGTEDEAISTDIHNQKLCTTRELYNAIVSTPYPNLQEIHGYFQKVSSMVEMYSDNEKIISDIEKMTLRVCAHIWWEKTVEALWMVLSSTQEETECIRFFIKLIEEHQTTFTSAHTLLEIHTALWNQIVSNQSLLETSLYDLYFDIDRVTGQIYVLDDTALQQIDETRCNIWKIEQQIAEDEKIQVNITRLKTELERNLNWFRNSPKKLLEKYHIHCDIFSHDSQYDKKLKVAKKEVFDEFIKNHQIVSVTYKYMWSQKYPSQVSELSNDFHALVEMYKQLQDAVHSAKNDLEKQIAQWEWEIFQSILYPQWDSSVQTVFWNRPEWAFKFFKAVNGIDGAKANKWQELQSTPPLAQVIYWVIAFTKEKIKNLRRVRIDAVSESPESDFETLFQYMKNAIAKYQIWEISDSQIQEARTFLIEMIAKLRKMNLTELQWELLDTYESLLTIKEDAKFYDVAQQIWLVEMQEFAQAAE